MCKPRVTLGVVVMLLSIAAMRPASAQPGSCAQVFERSMLEVDAVLAENPNTIFRYQSVLWTHFPNHGPRSAPLMRGCDVETLIALAKRSRFFHEGRCGPQYCSIEFRGRLAKMYLNLDRNAQAVTHVDAAWIKPFL